MENKANLIKREQFAKINGYLEGLSNLITFFGVCYEHKYCFVEIDQPIEYAVQYYNTASNISNRSDIKYIGFREVENWKDELFNITAEWFFSLFRMQNIGVSVSYPSDYSINVNAELDKDSNAVSTRLIELIEAFFDDRTVKAYIMLTECKWKDEFDWEQIYFSTGSNVYVLDLYQRG